MERLGWRRSFLALAAAAAIATIPSCASSEVEPVPATGDLAKLDFTLKDMYGKDVNLASFRGRPIILNFWATWCGPCKAEIPALIELADRYKAQRLTVLGVSVDDSPEDLRQFAAPFNKLEAFRAAAGCVAVNRADLPEGSAEHTLAAAGMSQWVLPLRDIPPATTLARWLAEPHLFHGQPATLSKTCDTLVFLDAGPARN